MGYRKRIRGSKTGNLLYGTEEYRKCVVISTFEGKMSLQQEISRKEGRELLDYFENNKRYVVEEI